MGQVRFVLDIPIFHKVYELYKILHSYHHRIPKSERYTLWLRCENSTLNLLEILVEIGHQKDEEKLKSLYIFSDKLEFVKVLIRLAKDIRALDHKQYLTIQTILQDIGKMAGGWIKSVPY